MMGIDIYLKSNKERMQDFLQRFCKAGQKKAAEQQGGSNTGRGSRGELLLSLSEIDAMLRELVPDYRDEEVEEFKVRSRDVDGDM